MITATANAKAANLASNVGALISYTRGGNIIYSVALPCMVCSCLGNFIGSRLAIKNGSKFIRPVIFVVMTLLFAKIFFDFVISR